MNCGSGLSTTVYAPRFATLVLVESVGGAYMRDTTVPVLVFWLTTEGQFSESKQLVDN